MQRTPVTPQSFAAAEIRAELARQRIPQSQIATVLGLTQPAISRRLLGHTPLAFDELVTIARFLGIPVARLVPADEVEAAS